MIIARIAGKAVGLFAFLFFLAVGDAPNASAIQCPADCYKKVHIYNNTNGPIWVVFQAGAQDPDPWLQALFANSQKTYAETHLSRVYVNLQSGIPAGQSVTVSVPWYSRLLNDKDEYADWWNGGRIYVFDSSQAIAKAHSQDDAQLTTAGDTLPFSCVGCTSSVNAIYRDTDEFVGIPFQLLEHTFANVKTTVSPPEIIDLKGLCNNLSVNWFGRLDRVYAIMG
jgi:hypothetical protein